MPADEHLSSQFDGAELHRGLNVKLPKEHLEQVRNLLDPAMHPDEYNQHLKIGPLLVQHLEEFQGRASSGLGHHWTSRKEMAETAGVAGNIGGMPITISARHRTQDIERDPRRLIGNQFSGEDETTMQPGAKFDITDVRIQPHGSASGWQSVWDKGEGTGRQAWEKAMDSEYRDEDWPR